MVFRNQVKNGIVTRVAPCGFSKSSHKKMVKKKIVKDISLEDLNNIGYGIARFFKGLSDGINRAIKEDDDGDDSDIKCESCGNLIDCDCMQCHECNSSLTCDTCGLCHTDGWEAQDCWASENDPDYDPFDI